MTREYEKLFKKFIYDVEQVHASPTEYLEAIEGFIEELEVSKECARDDVERAK